MKKAYGITPAAFTMWNKDESFNEQAMQKYITWLIDQGARVCRSAVLPVKILRRPWKSRK